MNILFLGGAKRVSMGRKFINAAHHAGEDVKLYSYELTDCEAIASIATVIPGKRWNDPEVITHLKEIVREHEIGMVIPFVDGAVETAANLARECREVFVPVSTPGVCHTMFDKAEAARAFEKAELPVPRTRRSREEITYPCIAKPRTGSASQGIVVARDESDLKGLDLEKYLVQEYIEDADEYTVDCYVSMLDRTPLVISPRRRLATAGGEVISTLTVHDSEMLWLTHGALAQLGLTGAVTVQYLRERNTGRLLLMEINPRLGGGCVATVHAGGDIPAMMVAEACGHRPETVTPHEGVLVKRYLEETVFYGQNE